MLCNVCLNIELKIKRKLVQECNENIKDIIKYFNYEDLRAESGLRAFIVDMNIKNIPDNIPNRFSCLQTANHFDSIYGDDSWLSWPIYSTCEICKAYEFCNCQECLNLIEYLDIDDNIELLNRNI